MKLASALLERADLQKKIAQLSTRLNQNAKVQEGETPAEDPMALLKELDESIDHLEELIWRINETNNQTVVDGMTLTQLLARRDCLKQKFKIMRSFLDEASQKIDRYSNTEIKILSSVSVSDLQKQVDMIAKELRLLDEKIQEQNWTVELLS